MIISTKSSATKPRIFTKTDLIMHRLITKESDQLIWGIFKKAVKLMIMELLKL